MLLSDAGVCGGDETKLMELPLARGLQYQHAALIARGVRTYRMRMTDPFEIMRAMLDGAMIPQ